MKKHAVVIVMVTSRCNLNCRYCYMLASRKREGDFDIRKVGTLIRNCSKGYDSVEFCWHGGEPLLVGTEFYREVIKAQEEEKSGRNITFKNNIQSNGLLLDERWLDFICKNDFHLGISFDAPYGNNEKHRRVSTEKILRICENIKTKDMPLNVLCVISKLNANRSREVFNFFNDLKVDSYSLLPLKHIDFGDYPRTLTNEDLFLAYKETFDAWVNIPNEIRSIEPIESIIRSLLGEKMRLCSFSDACPMRRMFTVNQDGEVVPCSSLVRDEFVAGDIFSSTLAKIAVSKKAKELQHIQRDSVKSYCGECEFVSICNGGCRVDSFHHSGDYGAKHPFCEARKKIFQYIRDSLADILS